MYFADKFLNLRNSTLINKIAIIWFRNVMSSLQANMILFTSSRSFV